MSVETRAGRPVRLARGNGGGDAPPACPVHLGDDGVWHVRDYAAARAVLRSTGTRQGGFGVDEAAPLVRRIRPPVLWQDGPQHRDQCRQTRG
jgi:cytochrome P450